MFCLYTERCTLLSKKWFYFACRCWIYLGHSAQQHKFRGMTERSELFVCLSKTAWIQYHEQGSIKCMYVNIQYQMLLLAGVGIRDTTVRLLRNHIESLGTLRYLDLSGNSDITATSLQPLQVLLHSCRSLVRINIDKACAIFFLLIRTRTLPCCC